MINNEIEKFIWNNNLICSFSWELYDLKELAKV